MTDKQSCIFFWSLVGAVIGFCFGVVVAVLTQQSLFYFGCKKFSFYNLDGGAIIGCTVIREKAKELK